MIFNESPEFLHRLADEFEALLRDPSNEEQIHQFIKARPIIFGVKEGVWVGRKFITAVMSKFPVSPDRIPDFLVARLPLEPMQMPSRLIFVELKRASDKLFVRHSRMSQPLNDAWMECTDTKRLLAQSYRDFLRRLVKHVDKTQTDSLEALFEYADMEPGNPRKPWAAHLWDDWLPRVSYIVFIGRRSSLDSEGLHRIRELSRSTQFDIEVYTYDYIIDQIRETADRGFLRWPWE